MQYRQGKLSVILDSNFLFIPSQFRLDIFEALSSLLNQRFNPILLSPTLKELRRLAKTGSPKKRKQALFALTLAEKYCTVVQVEKDLRETHDDVLVRVASEWKCPIATNDRDLRKRLRRRGIPVIFLRQRRRLELEGTTYSYK